MRIKKMYQGTVPENKIVGTYTESNTDTYNCNYLNGKIISESGSNSNGKYIKFADGTMICTKTVNSNVAMTSAWGSALYEGTQDLGNFPATFIEKPIMSVTNTTGNGAMLECFDAQATTTYAGRVFWCRVGSTTRGITADVIAIGRWK